MSVVERQIESKLYWKYSVVLLLRSKED